MLPFFGVKVLIRIYVADFSSDLNLESRRIERRNSLNSASRITESIPQLLAGVAKWSQAACTTNDDSHTSIIRFAVRLFVHLLVSYVCLISYYRDRPGSNRRGR